MAVDADAEQDFLSPKKKTSSEDEKRLFIYLLIYFAFGIESQNAFDLKNSVVKFYLMLKEKENCPGKSVESCNAARRRRIEPFRW